MHTSEDAFRSQRSECDMASTAFSSSSPSTLQSHRSSIVQVCRNRYKYKHQHELRPRRRPRIDNPYTYTDVRSCAVQEAAGGVPAVPRNINEVVQECVSGIDRASAAGIRRMRIRALIPGLNPALEDTFPYSEKLLLMCVLSIARTSQVCLGCTQVNLRFKSAGTAASALQAFGADEDNPLPANVNITTYVDDDDSDDDSDSVNIVINPVAARGNPVLEEIEAAVGKSPGGTWLLFNPDFTADRAARGMKDQQKRAEFIESFVDVFYFRNLFVISRPKLIPIEKGAIVYVHRDDEQWVTYALLEGDYKMAHRYSALPSPTEISNGVQNCIDNNTERVKEVVDDEGYLKSLVVWAVVLSGIWYTLRMLPTIM